MAINKTSIFLALQSALLGEVYEGIRAIAFKYNPDTKYFKLRYYLNRKPTEDDNNSIGNVMAEFISNFKHTEFDKIDEECIYFQKPISELDPMDGIVFCRKENEIQPD